MLEYSFVHWLEAAAILCHAMAEYACASAMPPQFLPIYMDLYLCISCKDATQEAKGTVHKHADFVCCGKQ